MTVSVLEKLSVEEIIFIYVLAWIGTMMFFTLDMLRPSSRPPLASTGGSICKTARSCSGSAKPTSPRLRAIATSCPYISYAIISPGWPRHSSCSSSTFCGKRSASGSRMSSSGMLSWSWRPSFCRRLHCLSSSPVIRMAIHGMCSTWAESGLREEMGGAQKSAPARKARRTAAHPGSVCHAEQQKKPDK